MSPSNVSGLVEIIPLSHGVCLRLRAVCAQYLCPVTNKPFKASSKLHRAHSQPTRPLSHTSPGARGTVKDAPLHIKSLNILNRQNAGHQTNAGTWWTSKRRSRLSSRGGIAISQPLLQAGPPDPTSWIHFLLDTSRHVTAARCGAFSSEKPSRRNLKKNTYAYVQVSPSGGCGRLETPRRCRRLKRERT